MMEKLNTITLENTSYPFKCDNLVLEALQDEFGTLDDFEKKLNGWIPILDKNGEQKLDKEGKGLFRVGEPFRNALIQNIHSIRFTGWRGASRKYHFCHYKGECNLWQ